MHNCRMEEPLTSTPLLKKVHSDNDLLHNVNINALGEGGPEKSSTGGSGPELHKRSKSLHKRSISVGEVKNMYEYFGWVYHVGVNSIGQEFCHLRFFLIRSRYIAMYKRDPHENPGIQPIRKGVIGPTLVMEETGPRKVNDLDVFVLRFYNCLDETKKGEIACATAEEAREWMEAFDNAKQQAEYELSNGGSARDKLNVETEINLDMHRPRVRRYAHGLRKLIKIGQGLETLLRQSSNISASFKLDGQTEGNSESGDAIEPHDWKCVRTINGVRILEDVSDQKTGKGVLVKSLGVIDAAADTVFEVLWNIERNKRYQWDMLTADLELVDSYDGHYDIMYGVYDPKFLTRWNSKQDFVFSRQWFRGQDGTYTILQFPVAHKKKPQRSGYHRAKIIPSAWEIKDINLPMGSSTQRCLLSHTLEINTDCWTKWKNNQSSKFEKTIPYALLCQVSGLKEYLGANPVLNPELVTSALQSKSASTSMYDDSDVEDEFYDAIAAESSSSSSLSDVENNDDGEHDLKESKVNAAWGMTSSPLRKTSAPDANKELDPDAAPVELDLVQFQGSMHRAEDENDTNCWTSSSGDGFMIRGKTYLKDNSKVVGGDPLLKLIAVDWYKVDKVADGVALNPKCLVQSEGGKKLPFILVVNIQVPAKPNYSLVQYYVADRPINKDSLLSKFVDGTDAFRDSRLKLIPSIVEGYWMVKRAVGTKACLLGKALTCKYLRQDNFLEIDVDVGSSSVARSVMGIVMGYVTNIVVDLAILIEAKEETELPEYILGTVRLDRVRLDSAVPLHD